MQFIHVYFRIWPSLDIVQNFSKTGFYHIYIITKYKLTVVLFESIEILRITDILVTEHCTLFHNLITINYL